MSELWVAEHQALRAQVVVKFLSPDLLRDKMSVARFQREAGAAAQVRSPHVVQYFDHGVCDHGPYLVMELLEGEDLTQRLRRGPMPLRDVAQVVVQVSRALHKAHQAGIIHRDIKPDNIFLVEVGGNDIFCKLIDFGVAKSRGEAAPTMSKTATGSLLGTPYYMSPEQAVNAKDIDARTDIWAMGMVVFEAMTGRKALDVDGLGALILALHTADLPAPSSFDPALPQAIDAWFARCCAKEPTERFESARDMAEAFLQAIDQPAAARSLDTPVPRPAGATPPAPPLVPSLVPPRPPEPVAELPPKVPTLKPPPMAPRRGSKNKGEDDSWKQLIERSGDIQVARLQAMPAPQRSSPIPDAQLPEVRPERPKVVLWLIAGAVGVLLFAGLSMLARGGGVQQILFPGLQSSSVARPGKP